MAVFPINAFIIVSEDPDVNPTPNLTLTFL